MERKDSIQGEFVNSLDFSRYTLGTSTERHNFSKDLVASLRHTGFVKLTNYGIEKSEIDELFGLSRRFFRLTEAQKSSAPHPSNPYPHRGYSYVGQESISGISGFEKGIYREPALKDIKETYDMGSADDSEFPNVWPDPAFLSDFRPIMERAFTKHHECLQTVLECVAMGLEIPNDTLLKRHHRQEHEFRLLHYPEIQASLLEEGCGNIRIAEHSDFGSLTFLLQDNIGGLCVEDQENERLFHPVASEMYEVILNVGDCLQRWTGGLLRSANHKVIAPPTGGIGKSPDVIPERFSIAFFGKPDRREPVRNLSELDSASSMQYDDITAGEYNMRKLVRTY